MTTQAIPRTGRRSQTGWLGRLLALLGLFVAAFVIHVLAIQPRIAEWGSTAEERQATWPGDSFVANPAFTWTNAVTIDRPSRTVWPWLAQWGQGRAGLYSYDWLENVIGCDVHSASRVAARFQQPLHVGDTAIRMCQYAPSNPVALAEPGRALVLADPGNSTRDLLAGHATGTWAFILQPSGANHTRLIVRSRGHSVSARLQSPFQFAMQRETMLGIKQRAEGGTTSPAPLEPVLWLMAAAIVVVAAVRVLIQRKEWWRPYALAAAALAIGAWLMFWQPPIWLGVALDATLIALLVGCFKRPTLSRSLWPHHHQGRRPATPVS